MKLGNKKNNQGKEIDKTLKHVPLAVKFGGRLKANIRYWERFFQFFIEVSHVCGGSTKSFLSTRNR